MTKRGKIIGVVVLYLILGFIIYGNVINGEFFLDDRVNIVTNDYIKDFSHIKEIFSQNIAAGSGLHQNWYRPMLSLSYAIDYHFGGLNPVGYHLVNILLHIFSALLLFFVVYRIFRRISIAFLSGLIFLIHPVQTEAVSYVSGRADLLLVFFLLISFITFIYFIDKRISKNRAKFLLISIASFILALLSKETAVIFPGILILYLLTLYSPNKEERPFKSAILTLIPYIGLAIVYQILRLTVLNFNNAYYAFGTNLVHRTLVFLKTLIIYWRDIVWPTNLHYHYESTLPIYYLDYQILISIFIISAMVCMIWFLKPYRKLLLFGFVWFFIGMAPVSSILVPLTFAIGERWLYFSAIGLFIMIAVLIVKLLDGLSRNNKLKILAITVLSIFGLFLVGLGIKSNLVWRDGITFAKYTLQFAPQEKKYELHSLLATEYTKINQIDEALEQFKIALFLNPKDQILAYNLGVLYVEYTYDSKTLNEINQIIESSTMSAIAFNSLADRYANQKRYDMSIKLLVKVLELSPDSWKIHYKLGYYFFLNNQKEDAILSLERALALNPENKEIKNAIETLKNSVK